MAEMKIIDISYADDVILLNVKKSADQILNIKHLIKHQFGISKSNF